jgi:hypothetical protein
LARKYQVEFKSLSDRATAPPADAMLAGQALAEQYTPEAFIDFVIE